MDWINRLNQAIDFIEENLDGELDYEEVARIAVVSLSSVASISRHS